MTTTKVLSLLLPIPLLLVAFVAATAATANDQSLGELGRLGGGGSSSGSSSLRQQQHTRDLQSLSIPRRIRKRRIPSYLFYGLADDSYYYHNITERDCNVDDYQLGVVSDENTFMIKGGDPSSYNGFTDFNLNVNVGNVFVNCIGGGGGGSLKLLPTYDTTRLRFTKLYSIKTTSSEWQPDFYIITARAVPSNDNFFNRQSIVIVITPALRNLVAIWKNAIWDFNENDESMIQIKNSDTMEEVPIPDYILVDTVVTLGG